MIPRLEVLDNVRVLQRLPLASRSERAMIRPRTTTVE
jgi:hypothetical protein